MEVACGRRPIQTAVEREEEEVLIDWVRQKYIEGWLLEASDDRIKGQYEVEEMEAVLKLGLILLSPGPSPSTYNEGGDCYIDRWQCFSNQ